MKISIGDTLLNMDLIVAIMIGARGYSLIDDEQVPNYAALAYTSSGVEITIATGTYEEMSDVIDYIRTQAEI